MRSHYENTALDGASDVGAGPYSSSYRTGPITWSSTLNTNTYFNERRIAQAPTGWSIVCQSRPNVPREMAALMWYGIDDSSTSVHFPMYGSATRIPAGWAGKGPQDGKPGAEIMKFSLRSAFHVFNLVANWAYSRWEVIYPEVYAKILAKEEDYRGRVLKMDAEALAQYQTTADASKLVDSLTQFSCSIGDQLLDEWVEFFGDLFVKFRDGYVFTAAPRNPVCGCSYQSLSYGADWYDRIVKETGDRYLVPSTTAKLAQGAAEGWEVIPKLSLRAFENTINLDN